MTDPYIPRDYLPPQDAYAPQALDANIPDPLVNPPYSGINGWFTRIAEMFKRSWKILAAIFAITHLLPAIGFSIAGVVVFLAVFSEMAARGAFDGSGVEFRPNDELLAIGIPTIIGVILLVSLAFLIVQSAGYAAATYAATRQAAGYQVRLGEALGYGFKRAMSLTGWQLVTFLLLILGFIACFLPVFYVYAATALVGPILMFERRRPIGRSFSIFNNNMGRVLGRLAMVVLAMIAANVLTSIIGQIVGLATGAVGAQDPAAALSALISSQLVTSAFGLIVQLPLTMLIFSAILLTYTEQRGHEGPVNAQSLAAEL